MLVFGSLARGHFALHSDVDLLVTYCPEGLHYRIESAVEDVMGGLPFHVCYLDELPAEMRDTALRDAIYAFARLAAELAALRHELAMTTAVAERHAAHKNDRGYDAIDRWTALTAIASGLGKTYTGLERALTIVAAQIDGEVPRDPEWHRSLIQQMATALPEIRSAAVSPRTAGLLDTLPGFRHRERNTYGRDIREDRLVPLVATAREAVDAVAADLDALEVAMERPGPKE